MGRRILLTFATLVFWSAAASADAGDSLRVVPPRVTMRPCERIQFTIQGRAASTPRVRWSLRGAGELIPAPDGASVDYHAPWRSERPAEVAIRATVAREDAPGDSLTGVATVSLAAGQVAGSESCDACAANTPALRGQFAVIDSMPEAIFRVAPIYPRDAWTAGVDGTVIVKALVCCSGVVVDAWVVKSVPLLDGAAEAAVRQWRFRPALSAGRPVGVWVQIPVKFNLH